MSVGTGDHMENRVILLEKHLSNLQKSIYGFEKELAELKSAKLKAKEETKESFGLWKPGNVETYWYYDEYAIPMESSYEPKPIHDDSIAMGNCFQTKELCEEYIRFKQIETKIRDIALRLNEGKKIDWNDQNQDKYYIYFDYAEDNFELGGTTNLKDAGVVYCLSDTFKDVCIIEEIGEEDLEFYLKYEL